MRVQWLRPCPYEGFEARMRAFTDARRADTEDELWMAEHPPVFTLGLAGRAEHLLAPGAIPVVPTNRGGQVTFHGPGQVVAYPLVDLRRLRIYAKEFVFRLEEAVLQVLASCDVVGHRVRGAPGIYVRLDDPFSHARLEQASAGADPFVGLGKIAALGVKIAHAGAYHGVALNVAMDLEPFSRINPCGYAGLRTVDLRSLGVDLPWEVVAEGLSQRLQVLLSP
ncbi:MAG: lipoyl(octanoyl) transferase LipB [Steroidobacteraceae bacterium]|jgi:lipoyl(octanoyl) transferase